MHTGSSSVNSLAQDSLRLSAEINSADEDACTVHVPGGDPQPKNRPIVKVLGLAVCTGLGDAAKASAGAPWTDERPPAGHL
jgi:hypothetical protein